MKFAHLTLAAPIVIGLAACTPGTGPFSGFNADAGANIDQGNFGAATMQNTLVQTGEQSYAVSLNRRFEAEVPTTINFAFNSAAIDGEAAVILRAQADFIKQFPEVTFKVYGHTDLVGSTAANRALGQARAEAVVRFFETQGISRSRLAAAVSYGESQPLVVSEGRERANRRTVTEVSGFVQNNAGIMNGKYAEVVFRDYVQSAAVTTALEGITGADVATSN